MVWFTRPRAVAGVGVRALVVETAATCGRTGLEALVDAEPIAVAIVLVGALCFARSAGNFLEGEGIGGAGCTHAVTGLRNVAFANRSAAESSCSFHLVRWTSRRRTIAVLRDVARSVLRSAKSRRSLDLARRRAAITVDRIAVVTLLARLYEGVATFGDQIACEDELAVAREIVTNVRIAGGDVPGDSDRAVGGRKETTAHFGRRGARGVGP